MADLNDNIASTRTLHGSVLLLSVLVVGLAAFLSPGTEALTLFGFDVPVMCGFRRLTGHACPGCGLTRSFTFMAHGLVLEAFRLHRLGPLAFAVVVLQLPYRMWCLWRLRGADEVRVEARRAHVADQ